MYKVIKYFTDMFDENRPYNVGDVFPREGKNVNEERYAELAGNNNRQGVPLIELIAESEPPTGTEEPAESAKAPQKDSKKSADKKENPKTPAK